MHRLTRLSNPACTSLVRSCRPSSSLAYRLHVASPTAARPRIGPVRFPATVVRSHANSVTTESDEPHAGTNTPVPQEALEAQKASRSPFYFEAGYALFAKRPSRPFPPPFLSMPSGSFSDPLSTHDRSRDGRSQHFYEGELIRGVTNGDDAVLVSDHLIAANDGVGAWAQKPQGHAALWARLILHFWALEAEKDKFGAGSEPNPKEYLQKAYEHTQEATSKPNEWYGTTTASGALISASTDSPPKPLLYVTQLGDSQVLVVRPSNSEVVFKTEEQWHWFDCPRQLGTNSPDTPNDNAVVDKVEIEEGDIVLAMSDGVVDNLWEHEIVTNIVESMKKADKYFSDKEDKHAYSRGMRFVAMELVKAAREIAQDPFAECPFMERAIDEGLSTEGGKLDDISVVAALCRKRKP